ncbi:hypothetical protein GCM10027168_65870 [Streptomyces capparidis]
MARRTPEAQVAATASAQTAEPVQAVTSTVAPSSVGAPTIGATVATAVPDQRPGPPPAVRGQTSGALLARHLNEQAAAFLRALRRREDDETEALRALLRAARRIGGNLHTYQALTDPEWARDLREELAWLVTELLREHSSAARLDRLLGALRRLCGGMGPELPVAGAARAGALLERQLTLARTRGHSAALRAIGSSRFHALADSVAVLASEVPLTGDADAPAEEALLPLAEAAHHRLAEAADALPLGRAGTAYNGEGLLAALHAEPGAPDEAGDEGRDAPWHRVHLLATVSRYALEVCGTAADAPGAERLERAGMVLELHRDAAEAAAAAAAAARTPRIAPATAYALGVLHADQRREVEAARYTFSRLWHGPAGTG